MNCARVVALSSASASSTSSRSHHRSRCVAAIHELCTSSPRFAAMIRRDNSYFILCTRILRLVSRSLYLLRCAAVERARVHSRLSPIAVVQSLAVRIPQVLVSLFVLELSRKHNEKLRIRRHLRHRVLDFCRLSLTSAHPLDFISNPFPPIGR